MLLIIRVSHQGEKNRWSDFRKQNFSGAKQIIICGVEDQEENYILDGDVLYLKCRDKWEDLPEKMIAAFNAILEIDELRGYKSFLKIDADIVPRGVFNPKNIDLVAQKNKYIGSNLRTPARHQHGIYHLKKGISQRSPWKGKKYSNKEFLSITFALGGLGYVINRECMRKICEKFTFDNLHKVKYEFIYEDAMVGIILARYGIRPNKYRLPLKDTRASGKTRKPVRRKNTMQHNRMRMAGVDVDKYRRKKKIRNGSVSRQKT